MEVLGAKIEFYEKNGGYILNFHRKRRLARRVMKGSSFALFDLGPEVVTIFDLGGGGRGQKRKGPHMPSMPTIGPYNNVSSLGCPAPRPVIKPK